jgi:hypothetical protein
MHVHDCNSDFTTRLSHVAVLSLPNWIPFVRVILVEYGHFQTMLQIGFSPKSKSKTGGPQILKTTSHHKNSTNCKDQQRSAHTTTVVRPYNLLPLPWLGARSCWNVPHSPTHPPRHPLSANIRTITNVFTAATVS